MDIMTLVWRYYDAAEDIYYGIPLFLEFPFVGISNEACHGVYGLVLCEPWTISGKYLEIKQLVIKQYQEKYPFIVGVVR